jgi:glycosyltransferase involved in cell wall biosynthesis
MVGTIEPRKNVAAAIDAWRGLRDRCRLVMVGRNVAGLRPEPGLDLMGPVDDEKLPSLYSRAIALLFPSHYEGFGLPMLEAFQCGTPVVASRDPALMEVSGGVATHVDGDWRAALEAAMGPRPGVSEACMRRAADFSWTATARRMRQIYESVAGRSP